MADAPSSWPQFARALRKQALMDEMMEAQGLDLVTAVRASDASSRRGPIAATVRMRRRAAPGFWREAENRRNSVPMVRSSPRSRARNDGQS